MSDTLNPGDVIVQHFGPFYSEWKVERIINAGAVLTWTGTVGFVGFGKVIAAPNGDQVTENTDEGFLGRAHWPAASLVNTVANP